MNQAHPLLGVEVIKGGEGEVLSGDPVSKNGIARLHCEGEMCVEGMWLGCVEGLDFVLFLLLLLLLLLELQLGGLLDLLLSLLVV